MQKLYKAVIFDFDMTIADSSQVIVSLLNDAAEHFGYPRKRYEEVLPCVGNTHEIMLSYVTGEKDPQKLLLMREHYRAISREEMPKRTTFFPGVEQCLKTLKRNGIKVGLLSLKLHDILMASLDKYNLSRCFDLILGCEDVPAHKPDPSGMIKAMKLLGVGRHDILYIGDSLVDQETAKNAGVDFCAMLLGGTSKDQFDKDFVTAFCISPDEVTRYFSSNKYRNAR